MTAIIIAAQPKVGRIHVAVDAAIYRADQTVVAFGNKVWPVPHWPGLITNAGNAAAGPLFCMMLARSFANFDDVIARAEDELPSLSDSFDLPTSADVILAGISAERGPEAYSFRTEDTVPLTATREELEASECYGPPYKLIKLPDVVMTPMANDQAIAANYEGIDPDSTDEMMIWSLRKVLEMQRHTALPDDIGGIGGFASVTTISGEGITQRMVQRWPSDELGAPIKPGPIDWVRWHIDNPKPAPAVTSRVRYDMAERRARKLRKGVLDRDRKPNRANRRPDQHV